MAKYTTFLLQGSLIYWQPSNLSSGFWQLKRYFFWWLLMRHI